MRRILPGLLLFLLCDLSVAAQTKAKSTVAKPATSQKTVSTKSATAGQGYNIPLKISPYKNKWVYLGYYFGKNKNLADSAWINEKSEGVFRGKTKLPQGIYFMVSPSRVLLFEFLMDKEQKFSIKADTTNLANVTITGSPENTLFQGYTQFLGVKAPLLNQLQSQLAEAKSPGDSTRIRTELLKQNQVLQEYREGIISRNPNSMLANFFHTIKRPEIPAVPFKNGKADSAYPYRFVKEHWWDGVSLNNKGLVRTPFFEPKVDDYFKYYVVPDADSIIPEVNYMLLTSRDNRETFEFLLGKFTDTYINPQYMGQEKVFLFLFNNYFSKGDTAWLGVKQRQYIFDRAYSLMANQLGEVAPELQMLDTAGKAVSLYGINSPYTFITFWDPNCGHCKETVPRLDSIYKAKWKGQGVKLVGVNVDEAANPAWKKFVVEHKMDEWIHIYQPKSVRDEEAKRGQANFRQLYDVFKTPTLYLLDSQKRIIGKMLSIEQFDEVLQAKIKNNPAPTN